MSFHLIPPATRRWIDRLGATLSGVCAVHCVAWPAWLLAAPAAWGLSIFDHPAWWVMSALLSAASGWLSWTAHRSVGPVICAALGWIWLLATWASNQHALMWGAGTLLMVSHLWSRHRTLSCAHRHSSPADQSATAPTHHH